MAKVYENAEANSYYSSHYFKDNKKYEKMRTFFNNPSPAYECNVGEDMTIPDQSLSVRDILLNFTRGSMIAPKIETGDDEDIEDAHAGYDDMVDALDEYNSTVLSLHRSQRSAGAERATANLKEKPKPEASDERSEAEANSELSD